MQSVDISSEVRDFVVTNFLFGNVDGLTDEDSLLDNGIVDSTGVLELIGFLQNHFHIEIENDEVIPANLDSIQKLVNYISKKTAANGQEN